MKNGNKPINVVNRKELLLKCKLQLEYLNEKFKEVQTSSLLSEIEIALALDDGYITCPFCGIDGFDKNGFKHHFTDQHYWQL